MPPTGAKGLASRSSDVEGDEVRGQSVTCPTTPPCGGKKQHSSHDSPRDRSPKTEGLAGLGGRGPVTTADLNDAADDMKTLAEHCLDVNFADVHDLVAHVNNAAVLLRLCDRHDESEALLLRSLSIVGDEPQLRRFLALSQSAQDRDGEALATLAGDTDPEICTLRRATSPAR